MNNKKSVTIEVNSDAEAALVQRYALMLEELHTLGATLPGSEVIDTLEQRIVVEGREQLRQTLETAVQRRIEADEKKGRRSGRAATASGRGRTGAKRRER